MSKKTWIVCVSLFSSVLPGQLGFSQEESPMIRRGRVLFERHCATCHGQDAKGDGPMAEVLKAPPSDLTQIQQKNGGTFPQAKVRQFIDGERPVPAHGSRDMPIWGEEFRRDSPTTTVRLQIAALAAFLESIQE